jgi:preprotein translocase subunit SecF
MDPKHRRLLREQRERKRKAESAPTAKAKGRYSRIYHDKYKQLLFFTFGILLLSLLVIGHTYYRTGDVFYKGVSLSGGITITIPVGETPVELRELETTLKERFPENDLVVREIAEFGRQQGITIEAKTADNSRESLEELADGIIAQMSLQVPTAANDASKEITGPALGDAFFRQTFKALLVAFVSMGLVVFIYFGETKTQKALVTLLSIVEAFLIWNASGAFTIIFGIIGAIALIIMYLRYSIPSTAVILAAFSTLTFTVAVLNIMQMRLSTAGVAALLMLLGYSVDTDILLSTRVLKSTSGTVYERIVSTVKTGLTMTGTTFVAAMIALIFTQSDVIREIMTIVVIGIIGDIFFTWVQNSGILRMYLEKKGRGSDDA